MRLPEVSTAPRGAAAPAGGVTEEMLEPIYWQCRRKDQPWSLHMIFHHEVKATTDDSEVRQLFAVPTHAPKPEPSGETMAQRDAVCEAWHALPDDLRKDQRLARLYHALGGPRMDAPQEATAGASRC